MLRKQNNEIHTLHFDQLEECKDLKHAIFLRHGGVSPAPYESLNLASNVEDAPNCVQENLNKVFKLFSEEGAQTLHLANQVHSKRTQVVDHKSPHELHNCDALLTKDANRVLMIKHADCQATIIYDPIKHRVANVHSGWKGSVLNVYAQTIQAMKELYGSNPSDLLVCISPSLGPEAAEFVHYRKELPESFWEHQIKENFFDFWTISTEQLKKEGILPHHIEIIRECTFSNPKDYFSYRREKVTGRHGTCVMLKDR
jgi:YfiH family protein